MGAVSALWAATGASAAEAGPSVDLGGGTIVASTNPGAPTALTAGQWADVLGDAKLPDGTHEFSYTRTMADSTVHLGVVGAPDGSSADQLRITARTGDGADCGHEESISPYPVAQLLLGVGLDVGSSDLGVRDDDCLDADVIAFTVDRYSSEATTDLPIAVRVVEEAPVTDLPGDLPEPPESPGVTVPQTGADTADDPGAGDGTVSLADAPELEPGTTYAGTLAQGGSALYRVHLGWGEALAVRVDVPPREHAEDEYVSLVPLELALVDPMHDVFGDEVEKSESGSYTPDERGRLVEGTAPVAYTNRFEGVRATVPGDYWVTLAAGPADSSDGAVAVPFEITAEVSTGEETGSPTYPPTVQSPGGAAGPVGYDPRTPFLVADGVFAAEVPATEVVDARVADTADDTGRDVTRLAAGVLLGALSLAACAAGVVLLRRPSGELTR
ncbi:hypothetical protein BH11ACT8_BH11ACT8_33180 [soil metagenome]